MTRLTDTPWETSAGDDGDGGVAWQVCGAGGGDMIADLTGTENAEAHANAISAVSDMIDTLRMVLERYTLQEQDDATVRAAIFKATGGLDVASTL